MITLRPPGIALLLCSLAQEVHASPTRSFVLDSASVLSEGKLEGAVVESDGSITAGAQTRRTDLTQKGAVSAKSLLVLPDGSAFVGTGNEGKIYRFRDGVASLFAETKQLIVNCLARDAQGTLYAGTLPKGKIFAISTGGQLREFAAPKGAEHIWALVYDDKQKTLFAGTGPEGKIFAIDAQGKAEIYFDSEDSHIMALGLDDDGSLIAGTSDRALLLRLRGVNRAQVLYDFEGNEITALAVQHGNIAVAANLFPKTPTSKPATPTPSSDANSPAASTPAPAAAVSVERPQSGKGQLYRVARDGSVERLFAPDEGHLTSVEWGPNGVIYLGLGKEGHIHRVQPDHSHALFLDVDERQVLATQLTGPHPMFVAGDGAAIYELQTGAAHKFEWTSKVLDAAGPARFGQIAWRSRGKLSIATRSGNTDKPDGTWSDWSAPLTAAGAIASPSARFLQVRVELLEATSLVYAIEAFYLPQNLPALVSEVTVEPPRPRNDRPGSRPAPGSSVYKLKWKAENPDGDSLRYRLAYASEKGGNYRALLRESEIVTGTEQSWETDGVQDGYYRIRVEASDEFDNPEPTVQKSHTESEPFLVDNHPPHLPELHVQGDRIVGTARDDQGPITRLEFSIDGIDWKLLMPDDRLLDSRQEAFSLPFSQLPHGSHGVMVRASDARNNTSTRDIEVSVP
jgi:hypothetical protein